MNRFLIEVPHDANKLACNRAIELFRRTGSHFLTHADWGCQDGEHKAWIIVELNNKEEAKLILPPVLRSQAKIVVLNKFSIGDMIEVAEKHQ